MIQIKKLCSEKAFMSYSQIFILVLSLFAFSYLIYHSFGSVDAQGFGSVCCEETRTGNSCQTTSAENCNTALKTAPTDCENTDFCEIGCCISENTGLCNEMTSKRDCEKIKGVFKKGSNCNVQECKKGCCILGNQAKWTTEANCKFEGNTENKNAKTEWRLDENSDSEIECLFNVEKDKEGACLFDTSGEKKCVYTTLGECVKRTGSEANFARDSFCSNSALNTTCTAKEKKGCIDGGEDVFWFDSCGNKEEKADDCDLFKGTYCKKTEDSAQCKSVACDTNEDGIPDRENGESWCSYDGKAGGGKDPAGSRHMQHICYMGTERLAPCADFRNEICVQEDTQLENGKTFSQSACRVNQWRLCLDYNKEKAVEKMVDKCQKNPDCWVKSIDMAGSFSFKVCLPQYPPGFELNFEQDIINSDGSLNEETYYKTSAGDQICSTATQRCTEIWQCGLFGCICIDNCKCHTEHFTKEMNDFCISLGDCGAYINYIGEYSDGGYGVKVTPKGEAGPPRLSSSDLNAFKVFANKDNNQKANPGNYEFFKTLNPEQLQQVETQNNLSSLEQDLLKAAGAYGSPLLLKILTEDNNTFGNLGSLSAGVIGMSRYTAAISSVQSSIAAQIEQEEPEQHDFSMIISMIAGLIAYIITQSLIISMMAALLGFLFGISWIKKVHIDFTCTPWEPPDESKCNECNKLEVPCTEYRCESLGSQCTLINKGTGNELCVTQPVNETLPTITQFESVITDGYAYKQIENGVEIVNASDNGCIEPYTSVQMGIKVEPFARCRWSNESKDSYEDMTDLFGPKGNYILPVHINKLFFPNPEAFKNFYNLTESQIEEIGKMNFFVKCKTASGKVNPTPYQIKTCVRPGPDLTPPRIVIASPQKDSYLSYGTDTKEAVFYVNEPSECRWDSGDKDFDLMQNTMNCETNPAVFTHYGWKCTTTLTGLQNNTKFFIKCKDTSENKNIMSESFVYDLKASKSPLKIDEVIPRIDEKIISGVEPVSLKFRLRTSGGAEQGKATCRWEGNGFGDSFRYQENSSTTHEYAVTSLLAGAYTISFICEDVSGNIAENSTSFTIDIDKFGPRINRIYYDYGLKLTTNENAECRYSFSRNFEFDNATKMSGAQLVHTAQWRLKTYYIQCQDSYKNKGTIISVKPNL